MLPACHAFKLYFSVTRRHMYLLNQGRKRPQASSVNVQTMSLSFQGCVKDCTVKQLWFLFHCNPFMAEHVSDIRVNAHILCR